VVGTLKYDQRFIPARTAVRRGGVPTRLGILFGSPHGWATSSRCIFSFQSGWRDVIWAEILPARVLMAVKSICRRAR
jgi:hypothetical protein